ncbi:MAG TPA: NADH-quinone oxidoreductase subunit L [Acidimicrobiales bacterium]|nr:NADH-quinone oxidoreductase subunit L [Acidimicrobiales bacterium]
MLENAWIIPLLPAASFLLTLFFGKRLKGGAHWFGIAAVGTAFVLALVVNVQWFQHVDEAEHEAKSAEVNSEEGGEAPVEGEEGLGALDGESAAAPALRAEEGEKAEEFEVEPITRSWTWWQSGGVEFKAGMLLDGMGVMMLFVVTLISLLVHIYSTDYVKDDRRYTHYYAFLSLFTASMLGLIMAENTLQLIVMWELVGVCSFVLIGHWWEEKPNSDAALKAFLTNRVGDVGLLVGVIVLFFTAGQTFNIVEINTLANEGAISQTALLVASLCLLAAVMSKSGQFILHTWLPDAMAGPTPVSALIHAATMVVAGVFMVGRMYGVFFNGLNIGTSSVNALAVVGGITVLGGAGLAFVQDDIKKVLAYSTVSQLGYMVMALGVGAWTAAFFHLFTHALFKAGLFLGSGSVAHAVHSFDMKKDMGGMKKFMPKTYVTFLICSVALAGMFPFAGFFSKDEILAGAGQLGGEGNYTAFVVVGTLGALMTAAYMTRCIYLTFFGEYRGDLSHHAHDHGDAEAAETSDELDHAAAPHVDVPHAVPHESGPRILVPLYILSGLAVIAGLANLPKNGIFSFLPESLTLRFEHYYEPKALYFPIIEHPEFSLATAVTSLVIVTVGWALAYAWYFKGLGPHGITQRNKLARAGHTLLVNKYYFDVLYTDVIAGSVKGPIARAANWFNQNVLDGIVNGAGIGARKSGEWVYRNIDQGIVDTIVNGSGATAEGTGEVFRQVQTGKVQQYGVLLFAATAVLAGIFIIVI